jgi:hypothetical protein
VPLTALTVAGKLVKALPSHASKGVQIVMTGTIGQFGPFAAAVALGMRPAGAVARNTKKTGKTVKTTA